MTRTFLEKVTAETRERVSAAKANGYLPKLLRKAERVAAERQSNTFRNAVSHPGRVNIIAEIKRASPSKGPIKADADVSQTARTYASGGAAAISVLTEPNHFGGSVSDLVTAVRATKLPILRKDFIVDEYQIAEAAAAGAAAVLLIVAALSKGSLERLHRSASQLGLDALVEVHDKDEMKKAIDAGVSIIGVNNRDLHSLAVSLDTSRRLVAGKPEGVVMITESGLTKREEIDELRGLGYDAFLIGETLMRSSDARSVLEEFHA